MIINVHGHIRTPDDMDAQLEHYDHPDLVHTWFAGDNAKVKEALTKCPDKAIGFGVLTEEAWHPRLVDQYHDEGFKGLKVFALPEAFDSPTYYPIYEKAEKYKMPIMFHTGFFELRPGQERGLISSLKTRPGCLDAIARAFPDLFIIGAHLGIPWGEEACYMASHHKNVYFDLQGHPVRCLTYSRLKHLFMTSEKWGLRSLDEVVNERIVGKFVFGSGNFRVAEGLAFYQNLFNTFDFSQEVREKILWRNAAAMLGIEKELEAK